MWISIRVAAFQEGGAGAPGPRRTCIRSPIRNPTSQAKENEKKPGRSSSRRQDRRHLIMNCAVTALGVVGGPNSRGPPASAKSMEWRSRPRPRVSWNLTAHVGKPDRARHRQIGAEDQQGRAVSSRAQIPWSDHFRHAGKGPAVQAGQGHKADSFGQWRQRFDRGRIVSGNAARCVRDRKSWSRNKLRRRRMRPWPVYSHRPTTLPDRRS